jgi:AT-rich interactive domain-containing protein 2
VFQINSKGSWEELLTCFEFEESTLNGALGLKQVYLRHLEPYEKVHFQVTTAHLGQKILSFRF